MILLRSGKACVNSLGRGIPCTHPTAQATIKKKDGIKLDADSILTRFTAAGIPLGLYPTGCDKSLQDTAVRRDFMSETFGGNRRQVFPSIDQRRVQEHGYNDFMYLCPEWQPIAPEVPGAPGLWLTNEDCQCDGQIRRLFTRISRSPALWQYQGQYELKRAQSLTKEEWGRQSTEVSKTCLSSCLSIR